MIIHELRLNQKDLHFALNYANIARSTYYYHISRQRKDKYEEVRKRIKEIFTLHNFRYGYRRVYLQLRNEGFTINHKTVQKLMQEMGLKSIVRRKKYNSFKGEVGKAAPNILNRNFKATKPNMKWATDLTEFKIAGEKVYLSPIIDLFNREIISYSISKTPNVAMVLDMLKEAKKKVKNTEKVILHSDQGYQYRSYLYQETLKDFGIIQSMSRKGNCLDNAVIENFFSIFKTEFLYLHKFNDMDSFNKELKIYIDYYNNERIKLNLNGMSPVQYRTHTEIFVNN